MQIDYHSVLAMPSSPGPDHAQSNSPINQQSESCEQRTENTAPSVELVTAIVEEDSAHQTVFLDHNGNLSFTDPLHPVDKVQSHEDSTLLAVSSTSELPRRPTQGSTKNQHNNSAVTSRVTRSNNITEQTIQKLPNNKPKKKSAPTRKPLVGKRHSNLGFPQTMTFDGQLRGEILIQGHSAAPIDVDKLEENIPPSKTQKRRSMAAATTDRAVMNPLDEQPQPEDLSLEINLSPADFKPESKKRAIRNIEDNEAIHVDQERPAKRNRIDTDKPSHPALPYQRKKYGRSGRTSSPRAEPPAIPTVDFDEIHDPKPTGVEGPNSRASAMNGKRSGKKTQPKPAAAPKKRKQEPQDIKLDVKPIAPEVPVSLAKAERDKQTVESLLETDHHEPVEQRTTPGRETEPDCHSTTLTQAPIIAQTITTQGHNENNSRKKAQTVPWEDKNFQQKTDGALDLAIRLPSTKGIRVQKEDETWDHDHSLTLVVDDNDYTQDKEAVEVKSLFPSLISDN